MVRIRERITAAFIGALAMTAVLLTSAGCRDQVVSPRSLSQCPPVEQPPVEYTGGLKGLVLTPGGECTFQIDRENSTAFPFKKWKEENFDDVVEIEVIFSEAGLITDVRLLNESLRHDGPFFTLSNFLKRDSKWKFKDACYYGSLKYTFDPGHQTVTIDRGGLIENITDWEGCDRNAGDSLCYISHYRDADGRWQPRINVVN